MYTLRQDCGNSGLLQKCRFSRCVRSGDEIPSVAGVGDRDRLLNQGMIHIRHFEESVFCRYKLWFAPVSQILSPGCDGNRSVESSHDLKDAHTDVLVSPVCRYHLIKFDQINVEQNLKIFKKRVPETGTVTSGCRYEKRSSPQGRELTCKALQFIPVGRNDLIVTC